MNGIKRLDLNLLVTLEALLSEQNVTRAAERLHLSQPAVSAQLSRLRLLFGDPLLIPAQRGMVPTARALELREPLCQALDTVRATLHAHQRFDPALADLSVAIACTDYLQVAIVQPLLVALRERAPGVRIALRHLDPDALETQMNEGEVDVALMTPGEGQGRLRSRHLFDERYVLIGRRQHPALEDVVDLEAFARLDQVVVSLRGGAFRTAVDEMLAAQGLTRRVVLSASSFLFVPEIVATSDLVALVPERLVRHRHEQLSIKDSPLPMPRFAVAMLWHERNHAHAGHRWLREEISTLANQF